MFNKVTFCGNLTRDIELRYSPSGSAIATTGIASTRKFKKTDGSQGEEVCFVDLTFFGRTAEIVNQYLQKGSKVLVEGRLKLDQWTDQSGAKRSKHSITVEELVMLDGKSENSAPQPEQAPKVETYNAQCKKTAEYDIQEIDINDDEIPF